MSDSSLQHGSDVKRDKTPRRAASSRAPRPTDKPARPSEPVMRKPTEVAVDKLAATPAADESSAESSSESEPRGLWFLLRKTPSWFYSALVHSVALVILGFVTLSVRQAPPDMALIASNDSSYTEPLEELQVETPPMELETLEVQPSASEMVDPGAIALGDVAMSSEVVSAAGVGVMDSSPIGEIGEMFGTEGNGMAESGIGEGGATFFGVQTKGNKFIFVVDNSNSMGAGRFETAVAEIVNSVGRLDRTQYFYVIFFSDTAYPLFYPDTSPRMVPATPENKQKLVRWLATVQMCQRTDGEKAMAMAFAFKPNAIYLLGDGAFGDKTIQKSLALNAPDITIHAMGFDMKPKDAKGFQSLAEHYKGTYSNVKVPPAMKLLEKQINRPHNQAPNGVWGIALGQPKKKKNK